MPRHARVAPGGYVYHALNRAVARLPLFEKPADYAAFEQVMRQAHERCPIRILDYCIMPNHWHMVLWPRDDGELTAFLRWMTHTHTMRWHAYHRTTGTGHLYQGRFKAFPVQTDGHYLRVCRYVERNALRAGLTLRAEQWRWGSLWRRVSGDGLSRVPLTEWPISEPKNWLDLVNEPQDPAELEAVRDAVRRGSPFGETEWRERATIQLSLEHTSRPKGRPRREKGDAALFRS